jgi:hydrogenase-4 component B
VTPLELVALALLAAAATALLALSCGRAGRVANALGVAGAFVVSGALLAAALGALLHGSTTAVRLPWAMPGGALRLEVDPLSALFLLPIGLLAAPCALAFLGSLRARPQTPSTAWFLFHIMVGAMALVVVARDALLFLIAWEGMVLAAFFLVVAGARPSLGEAERERAFGGGLAFLFASHLGTALLVVLLLQRSGGPGALWPSADGESWSGTPWPWCWLALVGFGTKAALVPFHTWAKDAYGGAPGPIAALLSGAMSKLGIYGLLRLLVVFSQREPPPAAFAWVLLAMGLVSMAFGALLSIAQRELRRMVAATSIESAGLVATAIAVALLAKAAQAQMVALLALSAALIHVVNDALFKGLLFIGAGAADDAAGGDRLERLGGLMKLLPVTGLFFLVGAASACGLPPFNGFVSELWLITGALEGAATQAPATAAPLFAVVGAAALTAALLVASFARAFGTAFLGAPRDPAVAAAQEPPAATRVAMFFLALLCLVSGLGAPALLRLIRPVLAVLLGPADTWSFCFDHDLQRLTSGAMLTASLLAVAIVAVAGLRLFLLRGRPRDTTVTWDCGYHRPTARMQTTASSFGQPLVTFFAPLVGFARRLDRPRGLFPSDGSLETTTHDPWRARLWQPLFRGVASVAARLRVLQHGYVHLYVLAIALTLLVLLVVELSGLGR